jgi:hypothetical protein
LADVQRMIELQKQQISLEMGEKCHDSMHGSFKAEFVNNSASLKLLSQDIAEERATHERLVESIRHLAHQNHQLVGTVLSKEEALAAMQRQVAPLEEMQRHWMAIVAAHERTNCAMLAKINRFKSAKDDRKAQRKRCERYIDSVIDLMTEKLQGKDHELLQKIVKLRITKLNRANEKVYKDKKQNDGLVLGNGTSPGDEIKKKSKIKRRRLAPTRGLERSQSAPRLLDLSRSKVERKKSKTVGTKGYIGKELADENGESDRKSADVSSPREERKKSKRKVPKRSHSSPRLLSASSLKIDIKRSKSRSQKRGPTKRDMLQRSDSAPFLLMLM